MGFEYKNRYYGDSRFKDEFYSSKKVKKGNSQNNDIVFCGSFSIMVNNKVYDYKIGKNISASDKLISNIISANIGNNVKLKNDDIGKLIKKNVYGRIRKNKNDR